VHRFCKPKVGGSIPSSGTTSPSIVQIAPAISTRLRPAGGDQAQIKIKCRSVLINPSAFDSNVVTLCRLIAQMSPAG
jgi:hypothetical protein